MGLARPLTYGSISWVSASRPVLAVRAGGKSQVNSGSTSATLGSIKGLRKLTLSRCPGEVRTELRVTSAPVPAVVGIASIGAGGRAKALPPPMTSR